MSLGLVAFGIGLVLAALGTISSPSAHAAASANEPSTTAAATPPNARAAHSNVAQVPPVAQSTSWTTWVEAGSNAIKLIQMIAFVFGAYQFWANRKERLAADATNETQARKDANYQAWQVVNAAQGKGGSGGRIDALADLAHNEVSLAGVNLDGAWLERINLGGAILPQASLRASNLQASQLTAANLERADLTDANLTAARLDGARLKGADLTNARLAAASLEGADLTDVRGWSEIRTISHASVRGVLNAPAGFVSWAVANGAVNHDTDIALDHSEFSREFRAI